MLGKYPYESESAGLRLEGVCGLRFAFFPAGTFACSAGLRGRWWLEVVVRARGGAA